MIVESVPVVNLSVIVNFPEIGEVYVQHGHRY